LIFLAALKRWARLSKPTSSLVDCGPSSASDVLGYWYEMNTSLAPRQIPPAWLKLFSGLQLTLILLIAAWQFLSRSDTASASFLFLYAMLNLLLVTALSFLSALAKGSPVGRWAFILVGCSFALFFQSRLQADSPLADWSALISWIASAAALIFAVRRRAFPGSIFAALAVGVFSQGVGAISDFLDDGLLSQHPMQQLALINQLGFAVSMVAYQAGIQYFVQSSQWPAGFFGRRAGLFSFWQHALPEPVKYRSMVAWYDLVALLDRKGEILFMNHGYAPKPGTESHLFIPPDLERFRYPIQLYNLIARKVDWKDKDALEVSCGLGGGLVWISRTCSPKSLIGLDIAASAVHKCTERYGSMGISFKTGDAQDMPFGDASFDIVINVESSLNYPDMAAFLSEVERVLRPGGHFLFADYRSRSKMEKLKPLLGNMRLEPVLLDDVTDGILRGLDHDEARKKELITRMTPRFLRKTVSKFAGIGHGDKSEYAKFAMGHKAYVVAVFRKLEA
jgi:ubiquinone/menaquinone biosynthesis C-methylase UbiE